MIKIKNVIAAAAVFAMTIASGFAMEGNDPVEPARIDQATEHVMDAPEQTQPKHTGSYYYYDDLGNCVQLEVDDGSKNCTATITVLFCEQFIDGAWRRLYGVRAIDNNTGKCSLSMPLFERTVNP